MGLSFHIQSYAQFLPLRWTRLTLSVAIVCVLIVSGYFDTWFFIKEHRLREHIRSLFPPGTAVVNDSTLVDLGIPLLLSMAIVGTMASNPLLFLLQDIYLIIRPEHIPSISRTFGKMHSSLQFSPERTRRIQKHLMESRISQTTLKMQIMTMLIPVIVMVGVTIPFTIIARMNSAMVTVTMNGQNMANADVMQTINSMGISLKYWDSDFVREAAITSWAVIGLVIVLVGVTFYALILSRNTPLDVFRLPNEDEEHSSFERSNEKIVPIEEGVVPSVV